MHPLYIVHSVLGISICKTFVAFQTWSLSVGTEYDNSARVAGDDVEYNGVIEIPNLSDENEADEIDVSACFIQIDFYSRAAFHHFFAASCY